MTDEPMIDKLERLEREATETPWEHDGKSQLLCPPNDATLIVAMRNALPALLSQLREQREALEQAEKEWAVALVAGTNGDPDLILAVTTKRIELREAAALAPNTEGTES
jgi:hypothetical protein